MMKISELIRDLQIQIMKYGDLNVKIESSFGAYQEQDVLYINATRECQKKDEYPLCSGEAYLLLSSDPSDCSLPLP